jgi:hypothetical protein
MIKPEHLLHQVYYNNLVDSSIVLFPFIKKRITVQNSMNYLTACRTGFAFKQADIINFYIH